MPTARPNSIAEAPPLPRRTTAYPSPVDWRDEVLYFLLVDRFSDGKESQRPLLDRNNRAAARGANWDWEKWAQSGSDRFQGGTLKGVQSKLPYLKNLGITAIWLSPVFKQRAHLDTYHGYGVQDFLDVDPRFGTREDLVDLVKAAHDSGLRIILDIIFNHSGRNWDYHPNTPGGTHRPHYAPFPHQHEFGGWLDSHGQPDDADPQHPDEGVWPEELQDKDAYTRAGKANLSESAFMEDAAEHKRGDFEDLRDFNLDRHDTLSNLAWCYKYWIALTDCDGFRIDTLKHVTKSHAHNFCGSVKEFAANIGKERFFLVAEVAGGDEVAKFYLDALERNVDAALDIGGMRETLVQVAQGLRSGRDYFAGFEPDNIHVPLGSHRNLGGRVVSVLNDHDHVFGPKLRMAVDAPNDHQTAAATAIQLFTLGIPCIYYGTEQALSGPESAVRGEVPGWGGHDRYLRETMFGADHPRASGHAGIAGDLDQALPGFGAFGTAGAHVFDEQHPAYARIARLAKLRKEFPVLRLGRQYQRETSFLGGPFIWFHGGGELLAWSRILDDEEAVVAVNTHGNAARGAKITVDASLNPTGSKLTIIEDTGNPAREGTTLTVQEAGGRHFVELMDVGASEVVVLSNKP